MIVNVEILEFPENGGQAVGRVIEIVGLPDEFGVDVEIMIRKHHVPHEFPPEVLEQARAVAQGDSALRPRLANRRGDFRDTRDCHHRRRNGTRFR